MAQHSLASLLDNLNHHLLYNADLISILKDDVDQLYDEFEMFKACIEDCLSNLKGTRVPQGFVLEIKGVVSKAEDVIETFLIHAFKQRAKSPIGRILKYSNEVSIAKREIESIKEMVKEMYKSSEIGFIKFLDSQVDSQTARRHRSNEILAVEDVNVVGFEEEANAIIRSLCGESKDLEVISITGVTGIGKTALARKIYNDYRVEYVFHHRAFVHVGKEYKKREVFLSILRALARDTQDMNSVMDKRLARILQNELERTRYLIILDSVWQKESWVDLKAVFPNNKKGSRVVLTTQNTNVALHANPRSQPHELGLLNLWESRMLLQLKVFGNRKPPSELEELIEVVASKCGGLPATIVAIAEILKTRHGNVRWWKRFVNNVHEYIANDQKRDTKSMAYENLSYHLKPCFLYLGVFPADFLIPAWKLIRLWIAEGFIQQDGNVSLEDIAEEYLEELVDKNLVFVATRSLLTGRIQSCLVHGTLLEMCKKEALEENLFEEIKSQRSYGFKSRSFDNSHRLFTHSNTLDLMNSKPSFRRARSFLCFSKDDRLGRNYIPSFWRSFKLLKVLDIESIILPFIPDQLYLLVLLKYIAICSHSKFLPAALSDLWNLQSLIIQTYSSTLEIKADISKMLQLRHFHTKASAYFLCSSLAKTPKGKDVLIQLQTLSTISPNSCTEELFTRTPNLKKLGICGKIASLLEVRGESVPFDNLAKLYALENLKLLNVSSKLSGLPREHKFPAKLTKLTLMNTMLDWKHVSTLGKLENLEVLKLKDNAFEGESWHTEEGDFLHLTALHIGQTNLRVWRASADHFPRLRCLSLSHCRELEAIPFDLADISSLQIIKLDYTNPSVATSARKIQLQKMAELDAGIGNGAFELSVYPPFHDY